MRWDEYFRKRSIVIDEGFGVGPFDGSVAVEDQFAVGPVANDFLSVLQIEAWVGVDIPIRIIGVVVDKGQFLGGGFDGFHACSS